MSGEGLLERGVKTVLMESGDLGVVFLVRREVLAGLESVYLFIFLSVCG